MKYMLDTNICIYVIKKKPDKVVKEFLKYKKGDLVISSIVLAELEYGVQKSQYHEKSRAALALFLTPLEIVPFDSNAAKEYGKIRSDLEKKGTPIGGMDMLIAAHALNLKLPLVTNNEGEFKKVPKLKVVNWT